MFFLKYFNEVFCVRIFALIGGGGRNKACGWLMRYIEEVTWSAHWGLSNFLQPGQGDAQPQTSGAFRLHHFASLGATALPSLSPLSLYFMDLGVFLSLSL